MTFLLALFHALALHAEPAPRTLSEYLNGPVNPGDVVCSVDRVCYLTVAATPVLTAEDDPSGALARGAVVPTQRPFKRVEISQILGELERGAIKPEGPIDVYVKIAYEATDSGPLGKSLSGRHVVHGRLKIEDGVAHFEVTGVPDMVILQTFMPKLDLAEAFGMTIGSDNEPLRLAFNLWLETILTRVLPNALGLTPAVAPRP